MVEKKTEARVNICKVEGETAICLSEVKNWFAEFRKALLESNEKPRHVRPKNTEDEPAPPVRYTCNTVWPVESCEMLEYGSFCCYETSEGNGNDPKSWYLGST